VSAPRPRTRPILAALAVAAAGLLVGLTASSRLRADAERPAPPPPRTLTELDTQLAALNQRLDHLIELANLHPRWRDLKEYLGYTARDLADSHRRVKAKDIVEMFADPTVPFDLRRQARDALASAFAMKNDPDLDRGDNHRKPRNDFARRFVVKLVKDDDEYSRQLAHELLLKWFPQMGNDPAIGLYKARDGNRAGWRAAYNAWLKGLR
jgi:hypothetical protein